MRGQDTGRNLPVWKTLVCPHRQRLWKNSSSLSWVPHVVFEEGGVEAVFALLPCWSVERIWFLRWGFTYAVLAQPLGSRQWGLWLAAPFPSGMCCCLSRAAMGAGMARGTVQEKEQQCFFRWPVPGTAMMKAAGWPMAVSFSSLPHLLRQRWQKHTVWRRHMQGAESPAQPKSRTWRLGSARAAHGGSLPVTFLTNLTWWWRVVLSLLWSDPCWDKKTEVLHLVRNFSPSSPKGNQG